MKKKFLVILSAILVTGIIVLSVVIVKHNLYAKEELDDIQFSLLVNSYVPSDIINSKRKSNSCIHIYPDKQSNDICVEGADKIYYSVFSGNELFSAIMQNDDIKLVRVDSQNKIVDSIKVYSIPKSLYAYKNTLFALFAENDEGTLYYVDFENEKLVSIIANIKIKSVYSSVPVFINETGIVYEKTYEQGWYFFDGEKSSKISNSETCYGFTKENTLLFADSMAWLMVCYQKNINNGLIFNIRPIIQNVGIIIGTISNDGRYLFCYYGMGDAGSYPTIYDLETLAHIKYKEYEYPPYSVQWENTGDG